MRRAIAEAAVETAGETWPIYVINLDRSPERMCLRGETAALGAV